MNSKKKTGPQSLFVNRKGNIIFNWMEWVIMDNHSFRLTKKHTNLEPIRVDTLTKYIKLVTEAVEKDVTPHNVKQAGKLRTRTFWSQSLEMIPAGLQLIISYASFVFESFSMTLMPIWFIICLHHFKLMN